MYQNLGEKRKEKKRGSREGIEQAAKQNRVSVVCIVICI